VPGWIGGALVCGALLLLHPPAARAQFVRRLFEPTDTEMEAPGMAELDLQFGPVRGEDEPRFSLPDFEFDLGLIPHLELDIDGEYAIGGGSNASLFALNGPSPDNLWIALKVDATAQKLQWNSAAGVKELTFTEAVQFGPKLPVAPGAIGFGFQGLVLLGLEAPFPRLLDGDEDTASFVLNLGGLVDPSEDVGSPPPAGIVTGLDVDLPIANDWTFNVGLAAAAYFSPDPTQFDTSVGLTYTAYEAERCAWFCSLDISLTGVYGWLQGGDQYGVLLGLSPKFRLWDTD